MPSNYDPVARTYSGIWDGTFKPAYSNNPAWCLWDMLTHPRYGMGQRIGAADVDRWALYAIGQYCDQMVPDGFGGTEPRMTFNAYLAQQRKAGCAYRLLLRHALYAGVERAEADLRAGQAIGYSLDLYPQ